MEDPEARKARLKELKEAQKAEQQNGEDAAADPPETDAKPQTEQENGAAKTNGAQLRFRNYVPKDEKIQHEKVAPVAAPKFTEPPKPEEDDDEDILAAVAPKKANWDLKREIAPKLEKLERRTQRAMIQLLQQEEQRRQQEGDDEAGE